MFTLKKYDNKSKLLPIYTDSLMYEISLISVIIQLSQNAMIMQTD